MYPFLESIKIENREAKNIFFHQKRINETFAEVYANTNPINLSLILNEKILSKLATNLTIKCRIMYNEYTYTIEFQTYIPKKISKFVLVENIEIDYHLKFSNRECLQVEAEKKEEVIFTQNNNITDTSYSNLIFLKNSQWFTPSTYLLNGTQRQILLQEKLIEECNINRNNIKEFSHFKMINALLNFEESTIYSADMIRFTF